MSAALTAAQTTCTIITSSPAPSRSVLIVTSIISCCSSKTSFHSCNYQSIIMASSSNNNPVNNGGNLRKEDNSNSSNANNSHQPSSQQEPPREEEDGEEEAPVSESLQQMFHDMECALNTVLTSSSLETNDAILGTNTTDHDGDGDAFVDEYPPPPFGLNDADAGKSKGGLEVRKMEVPSWLSTKDVAGEYVVSSSMSRLFLS